MTGSLLTPHLSCLPKFPIMETTSAAARTRAIYEGDGGRFIDSLGLSFFEAVIVGRCN